MVQDTDFRQSLDEDTKNAMHDMLAALEPFRALRQTMPLQYIVSFLLVALDEGRGVNEYAERAGVGTSVMSRHLLDIGERNRHMEEGFGLVTQRPDPMELRKHQMMLTPKGRAVAHQIARHLRGRKSARGMLGVAGGRGS
jgi:DNA-binding MarR family transcriptional regulator